MEDVPVAVLAAGHADVQYLVPLQSSSKVEAQHPLSKAAEPTSQPAFAVVVFSDRTGAVVVSGVGASVVTVSLVSTGLPIAPENQIICRSCLNLALSKGSKKKRTREC